MIFLADAECSGGGGALNGVKSLIWAECVLSDAGRGDSWSGAATVLMSPLISVTAAISSLSTLDTVPGTNQTRGVTLEQDRGRHGAERRWWPGPSQPRDALSQVHQPRVTLETSPSSGHWWSRVSLYRWSRVTCLTLRVVTCHVCPPPPTPCSLPIWSPSIMLLPRRGWCRHGGQTGLQHTP